MKEERLIGNSGIQEIRQQCLDVLAEIREQAGVLNDYFEVTDNPEYITVWVDSDGKVIFGLKADGRTFVGDADFLNEIKNNKKAIDEIKSTIDNIIGSLDIDALLSITTVDNPGFIELETDNENKIISYRDEHGMLHEEVGIETNKVITNHLVLTANGMTEFQQSLKDSGFDIVGKCDWSEYLSNDGEYPLNVSIPRVAKINIITSVPLNSLTKEGQPNAVEGENYNVPCYIEFWDGYGNYFKKPILISAQGQSTLAYDKKNLSIDMFDSSVYNSKGKLGKGDVFSIKFGNWVAQDSFHIKSFITDTLRSKSVVAYKIFNDICLSHGIFKDYIWKRGLIDVNSITARDSNCSSVSDVMQQFDSGARCIPDGFPVILYQNGEFFGLYSWQLKKHRDNYKLDKKESKHVWIDSSAINIWNMDGNLDWNQLVEDGLEIRNPKDLYVVNNQEEIVEYNTDYDDRVGELIAPGMDGYDPNNKDHVRSGKVKQVLVKMSEIMPVLQSLVDAYEADQTQENLAAFKTEFESHFDIENLCDYQIISQFINHWDNFGNNWQWITYDGGDKWYVSLYDCDHSFEMWANPPSVLLGHDKYMFEMLIKYYKQELNARYTELKNKNILSVETLVKYFKLYLEAWGSDYYSKEVEMWGTISPDKPDTLLRLATWVKDNIEKMNLLYV